MVTFPDRNPSSRVMRSALAIDSSARTGNTVRLLWVNGEPNRQSGRAREVKVEATRTLCAFLGPSDFASAILPDEEQASENAHKTRPVSTLIGAFIGVSFLFGSRMWAGESIWPQNAGSSLILHRFV